MKPEGERNLPNLSCQCSLCTLRTGRAFPGDPSRPHPSAFLSPNPPRAPSMSEITAGRAQKLTTPRVRPRSGAWSAVARGERSSPGPRRGRGRAAPAARGGGPGCAPHSSPPARPLPPPPLSRATFSGPVPSSMDRVLHCSAKSASSCPFE